MKLFAGIAKVKFNKEMNEIIAMLSSAGELVPLKKPVVIKPEVEAWLRELDAQMRETLKQMLVDCIAEMDISIRP